jgi:type IV pilus assembly protein PilV
MQTQLSKTQAAGFSLIELMVALVVLSIGLLGIAKMSLGSVQSNGSAFMRSQATALVQQVMDDMRANQLTAINGSYNIALGANPGAPANCVTAVCGPTQIATYDLARWFNQLAILLPAGVGSVNVVQGVSPATGGPEYTAVVVVRWNDSVAQTTFANGTAPPANMTVTMETLL